MTKAYYNEIDPFCAEWLRELILWGFIAPGDVDTRSIEDVHPNDLDGYDQCHFFAGIGVWSHALRLAGRGDDRAIWTASCPCQPFSQAGKGAGFADERHLWPAFFHLVRECRPDLCIGEQVAGPDGLLWLDVVQTDMEAEGYSFGAVDICSAGVTAPHIRQRLHWVGDARSSRGRRDAGTLLGAQGSAEWSLWGEPDQPEPAGATGGLAHHHVQRREGERLHVQLGESRLDIPEAWWSGEARELGDAHHQRPQGWGERRDGADQCLVGAAGMAGFWADADWIPCRDGKWRPVEPGTFPLAHGAPARVGRLRAYGNAINAPLAAEFIRAVMDATA